ncbi:MAG: type II toxin-antitoxin system RelE/ParE family toxin [Herbiconiux sp.]|nr:type II toxin-antitoxin system RelE/ParE family toxin [Herbiconiux sp.]
MSRYRVELTASAARALRKVDAGHRDRLRGAIALLGEEPRPPGARALVGQPGLRVRVGDYRILYRIEGDVLLVVVVALGHRRDVYGGH